MEDWTVEIAAGCVKLWQKKAWHGEEAWTADVLSAEVPEWGSAMPGFLQKLLREKRQARGVPAGVGLRLFLPEEQIFARELPLPEVRPAYREQAAYHLLRSEFPFLDGEMVCDYDVNSHRVCVMAMRRDTVESLSQAGTNAGFQTLHLGQAEQFRRERQGLSEVELNLFRYNCLPGHLRMLKQGVKALIVAVLFSLALGTVAVYATGGEAEELPHSGTVSAPISAWERCKAEAERGELAVQAAVLLAPLPSGVRVKRFEARSDSVRLEGEALREEFQGYFGALPVEAPILLQGYRTEGETVSFALLWQEAES
jgi:hypothetical protein